MPGPAGGPPGRDGQATGQVGAARPGEVPSISYMEGTFALSGWTERMKDER